MGADFEGAEDIPLVVDFMLVSLIVMIIISSNFGSGGLELLFSNQRTHRISLPSRDEEGQPANVAYLVQYLCENVMKDVRKEMFVVDGTV